jgi:hypothetical protein
MYVFGTQAYRQFGPPMDIGGLSGMELRLHDAKEVY